MKKVFVECILFWRYLTTHATDYTMKAGNGIKGYKGGIESCLRVTELIYVIVF